MPESNVTPPETQTETPKPESQQPPPEAGKPATPPQQPQAGQKSGEDDARYRGVLADLQKERTARQAAEARHKEYEAVLAQERKRIQALAGVNPKAPEELEDDEIRKAFNQKFPHLGKLTPDQVERLIALADNGEQFNRATELAWTKHNRGLVNKISEIVADGYGGGELTQRQKDFISRSYAMRAETDPQFMARHEAGDETLIEEFAKELLEDWVGPAKRTVTSTEVNRLRPVPGGRGRGAGPTTQKKKVDFNNPKAVEDAMVESFVAHGGEFGGR